jgi:hypothetical protein
MATLVIMMGNDPIIIPYQIKKEQPTRFTIRKRSIFFIAKDRSTKNDAA